MATLEHTVTPRHKETLRALYGDQHPVGSHCAMTITWPGGRTTDVHGKVASLTPVGPAGFRLELECPPLNHHTVFAVYTGDHGQEPRGEHAALVSHDFLGIMPDIESGCHVNGSQFTCPCSFKLEPATDKSHAIWHRLKGLLNLTLFKLHTSQPL